MYPKSVKDNLERGYNRLRLQETLDSSTALTASGREPSRPRTACAPRGTSARSALPSCLGVPAAGHSGSGP